MVLLRNGKEFVKTFGEAFRILFPQLILQEDPHRVHADTLAQCQFLIVERRVERRLLEHLQLVDGIGRDIICPDQPWLLGIPGVCLFFRPTLRAGKPSRQNSYDHDSEQPNDNANELSSAKVFTHDSLTPQLGFHENDYSNLTISKPPQQGPKELCRDFQSICREHRRPGSIHRTAVTEML